MNERAELNDHDVGTLLNSPGFCLRPREETANVMLAAFFLWTNPQTCDIIPPYKQGALTEVYP